jgi:hypothetical protein
MTNEAAQAAGSTAQTVADVYKPETGDSEPGPIQQVTGETGPVVRGWQEDTGEEEDQPDTGQ